MISFLRGFFSFIFFISAFGANILNLPEDVLFLIHDQDPEAFGALCRTCRSLRQFYNKRWPLSLELAKSLDLPSLEFLPLPNDFRICRGINLPLDLKGLGKTVKLLYWASSPRNKSLRRYLHLFLHEIFLLDSKYAMMLDAEIRNFLYHSPLENVLILLLDTNQLSLALELKAAMASITSPIQFERHPNMIRYLQRNPESIFHVFPRLSSGLMFIILGAETIPERLYAHDSKFVIHYLLDIISNAELSYLLLPRVRGNMLEILMRLKRKRHYVWHVCHAFDVRVGTCPPSAKHFHVNTAQFIPLLIKCEYFHKLFEFVEPNDESIYSIGEYCRKFPRLKQFIIENAQFPTVVPFIERAQWFMEIPVPGEWDFDNVILADEDFDHSSLFKNIANRGPLEAFIKVIQFDNPSHTVLLIIFLLSSPRADVGELFIRLHQLLPESIKQCNLYATENYFQINNHFYRQMLDNEKLAKTILTSPFNFKISSEHELQKLLNDDNLFKRALEQHILTSKLVFNERGNLRRLSNYREITRFIQLLRPASIFTFFVSEFKFCKSSFRTLGGTLSICLSMIIWRCLEPDTFKDIPVLHKDALMEISNPFLREYLPHLSPEYMELVGKACSMIFGD